VPNYVVTSGVIRFPDKKVEGVNRRYQLGDVIELDEEYAQKLLDLGALRPLDEVDPEQLDPNEPTGKQRQPLEKPKNNDSAEAWVRYANEEYGMALPADTSRADAIRAVTEAEKKVGQ
jgi:hypothetical protein